MGDLTSSEVSWWAVHQFVQQVLSTVGSWPTVGSTAWCQLDDDDPAKIAAIFDAAQHWALRLEAWQIAKVQASQSISAAVDCKAIARDVINYEARQAIRIPRRAS